MACDLIVHGASPHGETWCCDATLVSALTRDGARLPGAADADGVALRRAERRKRRRHPELAAGGPQQVLVFACEVGGRWNAESLTFVRGLVRLGARRGPPALRAAAAAGWSRRWWGLNWRRPPARLVLHAVGGRLARATLPHRPRRTPPRGDPCARRGPHA